MTSTDAREPPVHAVELLLPWYVSGTLSTAERREADEHLAQCSSCREELAQLRLIATRVRAAAAAEESAPDIFPQVKSRLPALPPALPPARRTWIAEGLRRLFSPSWVPATALVLLLAQSGALIWSWQRTEDRAPVASRGLGSPTTHVNVTFEPTATEQQLREVLQDAHARVVGGPTSGGVYRVEIPTDDRSRAEQVLTELRSRSGVVRAAELSP